MEQDFAFLPCDNSSHVTKSFSLLRRTESGATIAWASSKPSLISIENGIKGEIAVVKLPNSSEEVILTANITRGAATTKKDFSLTVVPYNDLDSSTDEQAYLVGYQLKPSGTYVAGYWNKDLWTGTELLPLDSTDQIELSTVIMLDNDVFALGRIRHYKDLAAPNSWQDTAGYWKNGAWTPLELPFASQESRVISIAKSGSDIYALSYNPVRAGYWKNTQWVNLSDDPSYVVGNSIAISGSDVYVAGKQIISDGLNAGGYWKNGSWTELQPQSALNAPLNISVQGDEVYISGNTANTAGYWKNGDYVSIPNPESGLYVSLAYQIVVSDDAVYLPGHWLEYYTRPLGEGAKSNGYWRNRTWTPLGYPVQSMAVIGCNLYAMGEDDPKNPRVSSRPQYLKNNVLTSLPVEAGNVGRLTSFATSTSQK
jgi:hypothetical protein